MTAFVESCLDTLSSTAQKVQRRTTPRAKQMIRTLAGKTNILITTHMHPDPDAAASCLGMQRLLLSAIPSAKVTIRFKGNQDSPRLRAFAKTVGLTYEAWDDAALPAYDAIVMLDTQPTFGTSPLPPGVTPTVVVDHHRGRGRRRHLPFADVKTDVGATASIIFSYFMELQLTIDPTLAAALLYGIECDIAGAAGHQSPLDSVAISGLVLNADVRKLWQMRYVSLPANYFVAFARAVESATKFDTAVVTHAGAVRQLEEAALLADGLLRCDGVDCVLVTAIHEGRLVLSLRSQNSRFSAGELMRRLVHKIGDGGGHRAKAGGQIPLEQISAGCVDRVQGVLTRRLLRALRIPESHGVSLSA
jgi:nanoRNase/pAp phosphatase (c-di-AMP/oligoRNAs hydrolase)